MNIDNASNSPAGDDAPARWSGGNSAPEPQHDNALTKSKKAIACPTSHGARGERNVGSHHNETGYDANCHKENTEKKGLGLGRKRDSNIPGAYKTRGCLRGNDDKLRGSKILQKHAKYGVPASSMRPVATNVKVVDVDDFQAQRSAILLYNKSLVAYPAYRSQKKTPSSAPAQERPSDVIDVDRLHDSLVTCRPGLETSTTTEDEIEVPPIMQNGDLAIPEDMEEEIDVPPERGGRDEEYITDLEGGIVESEPSSNEDTIGLVEAHEVAEEGSGELPQAVPYDIPEHKSVHLSKKQRRAAGGFAVGVTALVIVTIIIVLLLGKRKTQEDQSGNVEGDPVPPEAQQTNETLPSESLAPSSTLSEAQDLYAEMLLDLLPNYTLGSLMDSSSPQFRAFNWTVHDPNFLVYPQWRLQQRFALATFFYATGGESWKINVNWLDYNKNECDWPLTSCLEIFLWLRMTTANSELSSVRMTEFIQDRCSWGDQQCGEDGGYLHFIKFKEGFGTIPPEISMLTSVKELVISQPGNSGPIPSEIGSMSSLELLVLGISQLTGTIPSEIGLAQNLELLAVLEEYSLSGTLFTEIGQLTNLHTIALAYTDMSGTLPSELGNLGGLVDFFLYSNSFSGTLPEFLGQIPKLRYISLIENNFSGQLPLSFFDDWSVHHEEERLPYIQIGQNADLDYTIPAVLGLQTTRTELHLEHIFPLLGTIPTELGLMSSLTSLSISALNAFYANATARTIPTQLGQLSQLERLQLWDDSLTGTIPSELFILSRLTDLSLNFNLLTGDIESELLLLSELEVLRLSTNELQGKIPSQLGLTRGLKDLYLHENNLSGALPTELGLISNLVTLSLSSNTLTGTIPSELGLLSDLEYLGQDQNTLHGSIATELGQLTNLECFNVSSNTLSGSFPLELSFVPVIDLRSNQLLTGTIPDFICILANERIYEAQGGYYANTSLSFDCTDLLCGCDCDCL